MGDIGRMIADLLRANLGDRDRLAVLAQALLDLRLLGGARAELRRDALAGLAVGGELGLERLDPRCDGSLRLLEGCRKTLGRGRQTRVAGDHAIEALDAGSALGAILGRAVGDPPLGSELALDLCPAHGGCALLRGRAALLDQPGGAALGLGGGGALTVGLAVRAVGVLAAQVRRGDRLCRRFDGLQCLALAFGPPVQIRQ